MKLRDERGLNYIYSIVFFIVMTFFASSVHSVEITEDIASEEELAQELRSLEKSNKQLLQLSSSYSARITELENRLEASKTARDSSLTFAQWSGILLGSVAVLLTALGLVIAIFSFFGYQKIKTSTEKAAKEAAKQVVSEKINSTVNDELIDIFSEKNLFPEDDESDAKIPPIREFLLEAAERVIYRDIKFNSNAANDGENE